MKSQYWKLHHISQRTAEICGVLGDQKPEAQSAMQRSPILMHIAMLAVILSLAAVITAVRSQAQNTNALPPSSLGVVTSQKNPLQIAILHWYDVNRTATLDLNSLGIQGQNILCFDGASIWVASAGSYNVTKIRPSDGVVLGTYTTYAQAAAAVFDGFNIWIADNTRGVSKIRASDGTWLGKFGQGQGSLALAFDGANIWVANSQDGTVTKIQASDGTVLGTFQVGQWPDALAFDGNNIWVAVQNDSVVKKLRASDGALLATYKPPLNLPDALAFDGAYVWVGSSYGQIAKLRASDGALIGLYSAGGLYSLVFDGANIWAADNGSTITKLRVSDGATLGTYTTSGTPTSMAFDGASIWVAVDNTLSKF